MSLKGASISGLNGKDGAITYTEGLMVHAWFVVVSHELSN